MLLFVDASMLPRLNTLLKSSSFTVYIISNEVTSSFVYIFKLHHWLVCLKLKARQMRGIWPAQTQPPQWEQARLGWLIGTETWKLCDLRRVFVGRTMRLVLWVPCDLCAFPFCQAKAKGSTKTKVKTAAKACATDAYFGFCSV